MLGIAELPIQVVKDKLQVSMPSTLAVSPWSEGADGSRHVWTDGSVQLSHHPWLSLASYAVVAEDESLLAVGQVRHWRLSSYSAELWAVLVAFAMADSPLVIHTDSLTIANQFSDLLRRGSVQIDWTHANWWNFLHMLIHQRRGFSDTPLQLIWCPAHLLEHLPAELVTEEAAKVAGSNKRDILLNRRADFHAKQHICRLAEIEKVNLQSKETDVFARQLWLSKLNRCCKKDVSGARNGPPAVNPPPVPVPARQRYPRWSWDSCPENYNWNVQLDVDMSFKATAKLSCSNFKVFLRMCNTLRWKQGEGLACSVFELAAHAFLHGWHFDLPQGVLCTVQAYAAIIRAAFSLRKARQIVVAPLHLDKGNKCNGTTFPKGAFHGAEVLLDNSTLELLARAFAKGAAATPHSWSIMFDQLL